MPETIKDVDTKIAYLEELKEIAKNSLNANDFKDKVVYNKGLNQDIDNNINNIEQDEFNDIVDDFKINKQETINKNNNSKYAVELNGLLKKNL